MRHTPYPPLTRDRVLHLLDRLRACRIVVVGDVMLDRYLMGETERLSPEAPVPVVTIKERRTALGGAANVAANVVAIGASCQLVGVVGDDSQGRALAAGTRGRPNRRPGRALRGRPADHVQDPGHGSGPAGGPD